MIMFGVQLSYSSRIHRVRVVNAGESNKNLTASEVTLIVRNTLFIIDQQQHNVIKKN